jgi:hypothetical protein
LRPDGPAGCDIDDTKNTSPRHLGDTATAQFLLVGERQSCRAAQAKRRYPMSKIIALAVAAAISAATVPAFAFNPQPDPPGDEWRDYAQIKIPDDASECDFCELGANAATGGAPQLFAGAAWDDWEARA